MHPAFKKYSEDKVEWEQAILFYTNGSLAHALMEREALSAEVSIAAIDMARYLEKTTSLKVVSKKNKLKKKVASLNESIKDLKERLDIAEIYFTTFSDGFIN